MANISGSVPRQLDGYEINSGMITSRIIAFFLETMLFGVFAVIYSMGSWALLRGDQSTASSKRNRVLFGANTLMFLLSLIHLALTIQATIHGLVARFSDRGSMYSERFDPKSWGTPVGVAKFYIYVTQTLIGDAFMVYRLYVVWNGQWAVFVAPTILFLIDITCGYIITVGGVFLLPFFGFSFVTNALCTTLIMVRLLRGNYQVQGHWEWHSRAMFNFMRYRRVVEAIIQSAAIYSTASISLVVTNIISPNIGFYACLNIFPPLIGLVFSVIVLQIAQNSAANTTLNSKSSSGLDTRSISRKLPQTTVVQAINITNVRFAEVQADDVESEIQVGPDAV